MRIEGDDRIKPVPVMYTPELTRRIREATTQADWLEQLDVDGRYAGLIAWQRARIERWEAMSE